MIVYSRQLTTNVSAFGGGLDCLQVIMPIHSDSGDTHGKYVIGGNFMNPNKLTKKSMEAVQLAQDVSLYYQNGFAEPLKFLLAEWWEKRQHRR